MKTFYEVTSIRSKRATEREGLEYPAVEGAKQFSTIDEAYLAYQEMGTGMEIDKELRIITLDDNGFVVNSEIHESTY